MKIKHYGDEARLDYCPVCQKVKKDNPCFSVNVNSGKYMCHSTGKSGHISEFPELQKELNISEIEEKTEEKPILDFSSLILNSKKLNKKWLDYLKSRGIENENNINRLYRIGTHESMMIPVTNGETVVGIKYRSLDKKLWSEKGSCLDYLLNWQNINDYSVMKIKLNGFDKKWYNIIFNIEDDFYENWNYYSSYHRDLKNLYNPDIKGMKEKYGAFYYNIILSRIPYSEDIEFLNKLEWTNYKNFLKGKIDIEKNAPKLHNRVRSIGYILNEVPISESELIKQIEELFEMDKKTKRMSINLCEKWLEKLNNGMKVKEL